MKQIAIALVVGSLLTFAVLTQGWGEAIAPPAAVGEITYGEKPGAAICTGTLVAPDLVVTAGHCLRHHEGGPPVDPATIRFSAGRNGDAVVAEAKGRESLFPQTVPQGEPSIAGDVGLLRLDHPLPGIAPLPFAEAEGVNLLVMVSYRRDDPHLPTVEPDCGILSTTPALFALTCPAVSGNSGAPLLVADGPGWAVAGVMVARDRRSGLIGSWAARPRLGLRTAVASSAAP
ncbi:trypsin-like peptidase domain-containing protein [Tabrizicola sp. J26]|uniref:trypsin-like serine peptidase n=1 Tax=Alitabrizicola rongguiensis TaxID=2909234 RepID=UPI001F1DCCA6|nr:trypsin-like peptidase domain-containing protein [Tabrizicola rongguiensis]MCF1709640.1 trypsin-like peptidase domain-containing protein [Tabrizicola rongguiensis]